MKNIVILLIISCSVWSQTEQLQKLKWLSGYWRGQAMNGLVEEIWSDPVGNSIHGLLRLIKSDTIVMTQLQMITFENGKPILKLKHFKSDFVGWEKRDKWISFPIHSIEADKIQFEGMTYSNTLDGQSELLIVQMNTIYKGKENKQRMSLKRVKHSN